MDLLVVHQVDLLAVHQVMVDHLEDQEVEVEVEVCLSCLLFLWLQMPTQPNGCIGAFYTLIA